MSKKRPSNPAVGIYIMKNRKNASAYTFRSPAQMCACQRSHNYHEHPWDREVKNKEYIYLKHICYTNFRPFVQIDLKQPKVCGISYSKY
jgi:hypothetical protein